MTRGKILKEADTFTTDDTEIGDFDTHEMKIQLKDQLPVKKNLSTFQNPFTKKEIKEYVEDLLNRDWIVPSESNYYSPVVGL